MKHIVSKAFTFAATLAILMGSVAAKSQDKREVRRTIVITNGDTVIDGKKLSEASPAERKKLSREFKEIEKGSKKVYIRRPGADKELSKGQRRVFRYDADSLVILQGDSAGRTFSFKFDGPDSNSRKRIITMNRSFDNQPELIDRSRPGMFIERSEMMNRIASRRQNSQEFNYVDTDKDGITSRMSIRLSEANEEALKKLNAESPGALVLNDLIISPNFSNGKLNLSFNLADKAPVDLKIIDNIFKEVFSDRSNATATYFKQIELPKNGIYYIVINQGSKKFVRKLTKE